MVVCAAPAGAQVPEIPPDALVPNQQAAEFFAALETLAREGRDFPELPAEVLAPADAVIDQVDQRGEQVANWSGSGVDLVAAVAAHQGGLRANMLTSSGQFGPSTLFLTDEPFDAVAPRTWRLLWSQGAVEAGRASVTTVTPLSPKVILVERVAMSRHERAWCRGPGEARLYMDPDVSASEYDTIAFLMTRRAYSRLEERSAYCSITEEVESGVYRDRAFDAEGYRLPVLDSAMLTMRVVPRPAVANRRE